MWPQGLLDAYLAMIPKADGESTPLGQRPLSVLPVVCRLKGGCLSRFFVWVTVYLHLRFGFLLLWTLKRFCLVWVGISCTSWSLTLLTPLTLLIGPFLTVLWVDLGCLTSSRGAYFAYHSQVRLWFKLAAGLGEPWCRHGGIPQGCPLSMVFIVALYVPWCRHLQILPDVKLVPVPSLMLRWVCQGCW